MENSLFDRIVLWFKNNKILAFVLIAGLILTISSNFVDQVFSFYKKYLSGSDESRPVFEQSDSSFKVLVLPFEKESGLADMRYEIGSVIYKRLRDNKANDTLNVHAEYFGKFTDIAGLTSEKVDSLMKYNNADQVIYGAFSLKRECESHDSDKACFNYQTDTSKWKLGKKQTSMSYKMINITGIQAIRNGAGQEDIDYVFYTVAGISEIKRTNYAKAIRLFQKIKDYEKSPVILKHMAGCYYEMQNYQQAINCYEKLVSIDSNDKRTLNDLGNSFICLEKYSSAKKCFDMALLVDSTFETALNGLGVYYADLKKHSAAKYYYIQALKYNPNFEIAYYNLGILYQEIGNDSKAKQCYEKAISINPNYSDALYNLGNYYLGVKEYSKANEQFVKVLKLNSQYKKAWLNLGVSLFNLENYPFAKYCIKEALKIDSSFIEANVYLGNVNYNLHLYTLAKASFEKSYKLDPKHVEALNGLGICAFAMKEYPESEKWYREMLKISPQNSYAWYNLACLSVAQKNNPACFSYLKKAISINSSWKSSARKDSDMVLLWNNPIFIKITK